MTNDGGAAATGSKKEISVLQLLTRLVVETERLIRLADDINQHASTPQAKAGLNLIGNEVDKILDSMKESIEPLYSFYEIDPGLKEARKQAGSDAYPPQPETTNDFDEASLWSDVKKQDG